MMKRLQIILVALVLLSYQDATSDEWITLYHYPLDADEPQLPLDVHWSQTSPFNDDCPDGAAAGCGAVAVAQILSHYRQPAHGFGRATYTANGRTVDVAFEEKPIDWSNILGIYDSNSSAASRAAVANLVFQTGAAMKMMYGSSSSPANHPSMMWGLQHYLHFSPKSRYRRRLYYSTEEWTEMLNAELEAGHPVFYRGDCDYDGNGNLVGHMFVIDGRDDEGYYHVNFGHANTTQDKFLNLNVINQSQADVVGPGNVCYNHRQAMVTDLYPVDGLTDEDYDVANLVLTEPIVINGNNRPGTIRATGSIQASFQIRYASFTGGRIYYTLGFYPDGQLTVSPTLRTSGFTDGGYYVRIDREFQLPTGLVDGEYEMCLVSRSDDVDSWRRCWDCAPNCIPVRVENGTFVFDYPNFHNVGARLILEGEPTKVEDRGKYYVEFTVKNPSESNYEGKLRTFLEILDGGGGGWVERKVSTSIYEGESLRCRLPIESYTDVTSKGFSYYDSETDEWLNLTDTFPVGVELPQPDKCEGLWIFRTDGALVRHVANGAVDASYKEAIRSLPRGLYIIRENGRTRKYISPVKGY